MATQSENQGSLTSYVWMNNNPLIFIPWISNTYNQRKDPTETLTKALLYHSTI